MLLSFNSIVIDPRILSLIPLILLKFVEFITPVKKWLSLYMLQWLERISVSSVIMMNPCALAYFISFIFANIPQVKLAIELMSMTTRTGGSPVWRSSLYKKSQLFFSYIMTSSIRFPLILAIRGSSDNGLNSILGWIYQQFDHLQLVWSFLYTAILMLILGVRQKREWLKCIFCSFNKISIYKSLSSMKYIS